MESLTAAQLFAILQRTLGHVDRRLTGHGERVAVIMYQILKERRLENPEALSRLCLLGLLHDIGAYKTEEIDDLMIFESACVWEHSAYGYQFLKNLSPLGEEALPILYHHLPYLHYGSVEPPLPADDYAGLIYLSDRVDMVTLQKGRAFCRNWLLETRGTLFSPVWVDFFLQAEDKYHIFEQLEAGSYTAQLSELIAHLRIRAEDISRYLFVIAYAVDFRSEFMVLHTVTTVGVSQVLGQKLGLSPENQEALYYGSLLHDIGKVACPVEILEKPGRLTAEEMTIMKRHVEITREILDGLIDPVVLKIAARHHEKLDGSGYPDGLPGATLTCAERIAAVADIVSALVRRRSYKAAFSKETTLDILTKMRDAGQLCPVTTNLVLEHFDEVIEATEQLGAQITAAYNGIRHGYISLLSHLPLGV